MTFDVLQPNWVLTPIYDFFNEEGLCVFGAIDHDPAWKGRPRPIGRYVTTAWIPGNMLSEGTLIVNAELLTIHPMTRTSTSGTRSPSRWWTASTATRRAGSTPARGPA